MRILLIGSSGQLGKSIIQKKPNKIDLIKTSREKFDLLNHIQCQSAIYDLRPDWVINCAAYTNVDRAENDKEKAIRINGASLKYISEALLETGGKLIHISTDCVFSGNNLSGCHETHVFRRTGWDQNRAKTIYDDFFV